MFELYKPQDTMGLWWLGEGAGQQPAPRLIGRVFLAEGNRKVGLEYDPGWIQRGFALSENLPLARGVFLPKERDMAAGAVDDARPDRWGERVIRNLYKPARLAVLEYLYFAGDGRFGALGVSLDIASYRPTTWCRQFKGWASSSCGWGKVRLSPLSRTLYQRGRPLVSRKIRLSR